jgi:hypothetical protein
VPGRNSLASLLFRGALVCPLYDHLRDTLSAQCLAPLERLPLDTSECVEGCRSQQDDGGGYQAGCLRPDADPLYDAHDEVDGGAHVVRAESTNESVEFWGSGTDAEEEWNLDEDDDGRVCSIRNISVRLREVAVEPTYKHTALNAMTKVVRNKFESPSAKHRGIHSTPVLATC